MLCLPLTYIGNEFLYGCLEVAHRNPFVPIMTSAVGGFAQQPGSTAYHLFPRPTGGPEFFKNLFTCLCQMS